MTHELWATLNEKMVDYLDSVSLQDLVDKQRGKTPTRKNRTWWWSTATRLVPEPDMNGAAMNAPLDKTHETSLVETMNAPHFPIYMDYSATTPIDPRVADKMIPYLREQFGNPASRSHHVRLERGSGGRERAQAGGRLVGADPREIIWTSGATEGNNLAIKGAAQFYKTKGKHIVTVKTEHKAVLDVRELERQGFEATYLEPQRQRPDHGGAAGSGAASGHHPGLGHVGQ
jgi:hypothetical protein